MDVSTIAIDLAKDVFQIAIANRAGRILDRQRLTRRQFERWVDAGRGPGRDHGVVRHLSPQPI